MKRIKLFNLVAMLLMSGAWYSHANAQDALPVTAGAPQEIGRASCRERV